jgi:short-subunit dehydrogenase
VSVTTAYPGVVLTDIRAHGLNAKGEVAGSSGLREDKAMTVSECAYLIASGMQKRQREVVMTPQGKLGRFLKLLVPSVVERMALAALKDGVKPR